MEYLIRFVHVHETFRRPEIEALAVLTGVSSEISHYDPASPFCIVKLGSDEAAKALISRSILSYAIYELWGSGADYESLHASLKATCAARAAKYKHSSFRFTVTSFQGKRSDRAKRELIDSFKFLAFEGPIRLEGAELELCVFEEFDLKAPQPKRIYLGRFVAASDRDAVLKYDLKKRRYISRTSMDAELSLVTANMALAAPGKIVYDPFVGTGSFSVACAHFGAQALGSDIDGRSIRGVTDGVDVKSNFVQYGNADLLLDNFVADLTHTPLRSGRFLDGIICDPPYGIREGPKVLGSKTGKHAELLMIDGVPAHLLPGYIAPKRQYAFDDIMADVMEFAFSMLVDHGRLCMWMPTANDDDVALAIPTHPGLMLISVCVQDFNKWSRRLLTYSRLPAASLPHDFSYVRRERTTGTTADQLNPFRKKYFEGFRSPNVLNEDP